MFGGRCGPFRSRLDGGLGKLLVTPIDIVLSPGVGLDRGYSARRLSLRGENLCSDYAIELNEP